VTAAAAEGGASWSLRRVASPSEIHAATYITRSLGTATRASPFPIPTVSSL